MSCAGLHLSRQGLDVHLLDEEGETVDVTGVRPVADALRTFVSHVQRHGQEVTAAIESMTGARFVHDQLELAGLDVAIANAAKVKGIAPLAAKTDRIDARVLTERACRSLLRMAAAADRPAVAIAFDISLERRLAHSEARRDRRVPEGVVQRHHREMRAVLPQLNREGYAAIHVPHGTEIAQA